MGIPRHRPLKVVHLNQTDARGGAAIAAHRLHKCLLDNGVASELWVDKKFSDLLSVKEPLTASERLVRRIVSWTAKKVIQMAGIAGPAYFNFGFFGSPWLRQINNADADVIHLHWLGNEILSIKQISKIEKPCVVTLHDGWLLGDGSHLACSSRSDHSTNLIGKLLIGISRRIRVRYVNRRLGIVAPSQFMAGVVKNHSPYKNNRVQIIGHPISGEAWVPISKGEAKLRFHLDPDSFSILYSCFGGSADTNKGFDDFCRAVRLFNELYPDVDISLTILGDFNESEIEAIGLPAVVVGSLESKDELIACYCASDVVLIPSRYESFGLVAQEACVLGVPIVAYAGTGLSDFVLHEENGYLARKFDYEDLVAGLRYWYEKDRSNSVLAVNKDLLKIYSPSYVADSYLRFYEEILEQDP